MTTQRQFWFWVIAGLLLLFTWNSLQGPAGPAPETLAYSDFLAEVAAGSVTEVTIRGQEVMGTFENGDRFQTYAPEDSELIKRLNEKGVQIKARPPAEEGLSQIEDEVPVATAAEEGAPSEPQAEPAPEDLIPSPGVSEALVDLDSPPFATVVPPEEIVEEVYVSPVEPYSIEA